VRAKKNKGSLKRREKINGSRGKQAKSLPTPIGQWNEELEKLKGRQTSSTSSVAQKEEQA